MVMFIRRLQCKISGIGRKQYKVNHINEDSNKYYVLVELTMERFYKFK